ncbi:MAG: potassium transporter TrkG, partial [archaeon]
TSASTVTGLVVKETGSYFTFLGQLIICLLIQVGGLGYMSLFGFFLLGSDESIAYEHRMLLRETINSPTVKGIRKMARRIFFFIIFIELAGAIILSLHWLPKFGAKGIWYGIFHTTAAFNNAGFDILATGNFQSLAMYTTDITVNLTIASLIILGGIGFYLLSDVYRVIRGKKNKISYQTKVVGIATLLLLFLGTFFFFLLEYKNSLAKYSLGDKLLISFFNSVTPRTAGFSTLPVKTFLPLTLLFIIALMFIGASPGGTGGGVKTTTVAVIWGYFKKCVRRKENINILRRRVKDNLLDKAVAITLLSISLICAVSSLIVFFDKIPLLEAFFETTSAFGTVGLSAGITPYLSAFAKYLIMLTMFMGKIGVLTILLSFKIDEKNAEVVYPSADLTV